MNFPWRSVGLAVSTVVAGLGISYLLAPAGGPLLTLLLFAVLISALHGGHLSGFLATALSLAGVWLLGDVESPGVEGFTSRPVRLAGFGLVAVVITLICGRQRRHQQQLEELRDQHARLAEVMHSIGIGHWYSDLPTQQMYWDAQCKAHFGMPQESDVGFDAFVVCIHPEDRDRFQKAAERAIFGHTSCDIDFRVVLREGGIRWLKALGRGFYDRSGRPTRFDGITIDITRQKEVEAALADANRLKDDFLATLSHELRTPLNAVLGWARLLVTGRVQPDRVNHALSVIERNAQAQHRLVEELLDLSRIESGQLRLQIEPVDAAVVVQNALEAVRPAADARALELATLIDPAARWVTADADRLRQIAWNLLSNAVKFTPSGGRVTLALEAAGNKVRLTVRDTGCGISPAFLPRVFERFSQGDGGGARGVRGLGIGLAIVRELVEAHGGTAEALSEGEGQGATFTVTLPGRVEVPSAAPLPSRRGDGMRV
jgi:PAS domain S-box-containing protein